MGMISFHNYSISFTGITFNGQYIARIIPEFRSEHGDDIQGQIDNFLKLGIPASVDACNHRDIIFQKVVLPSTPFLNYLCRNRRSLNETLSNSLMVLLGTLLQIGPFHRPTLEYVFSSQIVLAYSSCLSSVECWNPLCTTLSDLIFSLREWKEQGAEVDLSGKQIVQALFSEGFEDRLEQMLMNSTCGLSDIYAVKDFHTISQLLGAFVKDWDLIWD
ncbi:hypothetical protein BLNAU_10868 [Blattamonas nauphoetae]|uniref:Uncharacterized protein n=1 Tax=Blattamonas nauphoetae TaxID=2049346 RepID=A0ABQ9XRR3_9EUKA|nr:hypothetical protein BLNAU_10868 [Blattamonas nauphoetae]